MLTIFQYECAAFIIDTWIGATSQSRTNFPPAKFPWPLLRALVVETYGGKIDAEADFDTLRQLVEQVLRPEAYEDDFALVDPKQTEDGSGLMAPGGTGLRAFVGWVESLPEREPPTYLGLPANAEKLLLVGQGEEVVRCVAKVREILDEGEQLIAEAERVA